MQNYNLIFYPKKRKDQQPGPVDIYARITLNGKRSEMSTGESYDPEKWNTTAGKPTNTNSEDSKALIAYLETIKRKIFEAFQDLHNEEKEVSAESIKNRYLGKDGNRLFLVPYSKIITGKFRSFWVKNLLPVLWNDIKPL